MFRKTNFSAYQKFLITILSCGISATAVGVEPQTQPISVVDETGELVSLRQGLAIDITNEAPDMVKWQNDREPIERNYLTQPPIIPHKIKGYKINLRSNKCLTCHSWKNYKKSGATKISFTHFEDRDGKELSSVSPSRYFCTQCHVPQKNSAPLITNTYQPIDHLK